MRAWRPADPPPTAEVVGALRRAGVGEVDDSTLARALYSSDASLYRVPPTAVVRPRDVDEVLATVAVCRTLGVPLTSRGAGTSIAGNAVGTGVVMDLSRHLGAVTAIDADRRTATVQPGVVQAALQRAAAPYGLRLGPDPSSHNRCTIGGMIGNNACGSRALGFGRTSDNVLALDVVTGSGERLRLGEGSDGEVLAASPALAALRAVVDGGLATVRTELGRFGRQVSGYALEHLLPEHGFDVARALVGSEGTLAVVLGATVRLVPDPGRSALVVLGYPDMAAAGDAVPAVLPHRPTACEGIDARILDVVRARRGGAAVPPMPRGSGWLMVEVTGESEPEVEAAARAVVADAGALDDLVLLETAAAARLWRIREDGAGLSARTPARVPAHAGWEDSAVPPERLGGYLRDLDALMAERGLSGTPYGHFGDGCLHLRIDFPLSDPGGTRVMREFVTDAARLAVSYGGSLSGEHGDGRARSELLPLMYSADAIRLFEGVKAALDPDDLLNPGVLVRPRPLDADVRVAQARPVREGLALRLAHDDGDLSTAVHRCTGVGRCVAVGAGGVMCPSYLATKEEKDSTRGRARVLQEMVNGGTVTGGWRAPEVHAALDLCLSCKGCASDCPTGVDMASYKAEVLHQTYRHRLRPRSHYALGWLPRWSRLASRAPRLVNALTHAPGLARVSRLAAGVDPRRGLPSYAPQTFRSWLAERQGRGQRASGRPVLLWADTFTDHFGPHVGRAAVEVLEAAGYAVRVTERPACCGLTWVSTGQLDAARRRLQVSVDALLPHVRAGVPVVGLEPSCTATLRSDAVELLGTPEAAEVAAATRTLAELLAQTPGWEPPDLTGTSVVAQPHCHHHAVMGWDADEALLRSAGVDVRRLGGCCGLAGNFGAERGHYDVSVAVAEQQLLPAVRARGPGVLVLADGFSCRTQLDDLAGVPSVHLAELLAEGLTGT